jgi:hypothetical protein
MSLKEAIMKCFAVTGMIAVLGLFGCGTAMAKDFNPPPAGSVCDRATKDYIGVTKHYVRVEVQPEEARTPSLARFNIGYSLFTQINGEIKDDTPYFSLGLEETPINQSILQAAKDNGSWAVVLPTKSGATWTVQVFVPQSENGKMVCRKVYHVPPTIDGGNVPAKVAG